MKAARESLHERVEFTKLEAGGFELSLKELLDQLRASEGAGFERVVDLGYRLQGTDDSEIHIYPLASGALMVVGKWYHVRFLGDFCDGKIVEVRHTEGHYARPRPVHEGQVGYDCKYDRSILNGPPDETAIRKALAARRNSRRARLKHTIFPDSAAPLVREQRWSGTDCTVEYLTVQPSMNTCDGVKYSISEVRGGTCCTAADCNFSAAYFFYAFMDALSLRNMAAVKAFIPPGGSLTIRGNVVGAPLVLQGSTRGAELTSFKKKAPGWAGGDTASCDEDEDGGTATCHFGGGGTFFKVTLVSTSTNPAQWYVKQVVGEAH